MVEITYAINARNVTMMFLHRQKLRIVLYEDGRVDIKDEHDGNNGKALTEIDITRDDWKEEGEKGGSLESLIESNLKLFGFEVKRDEEKRIVYAKKTMYSYVIYTHKLAELFKKDAGVKITFYKNGKHTLESCSNESDSKNDSPDIVGTYFYSWRYFKARGLREDLLHEALKRDWSIGHTMHNADGSQKCVVCVRWDSRTPKPVFI